MKLDKNFWRKKNMKEWYKSKTLWVNGLAFIAGVAAWASGQAEAGVSITLASFVNFSLRWITKNEIYF
jgi:hypothetical protein